MSLEQIGGGGSKTEEEVEDIVGAMAEAGYGLRYDDAQGLIARTRRGPNPFDAAQSFNESGLTIDLNDTVVGSGSIELMTNSPVSTASRPDDDSTFGGNAGTEYGLFINPNTDITGVEITVSSNTSGAGAARLKDGSTVLDETVGSFSAGDTATLTAPMNAGQRYAVVLWNENEWTNGQLAGANFPFESSNIDITFGHYYDGGTTDDCYAISDVTALETRNQGTALVEWPEPADLYEWDVATFTATEEGETVDVYVGINDGNGWQRANGGAPISRNYSLADDSAISPSDEVRIEAELQRDDTSNNPTLDSAYRSWEL